MSTTANGATGDAREVPALQRRLEILTKKANTGDPQALEKLRQLLDENPWIFQWLGDATRIAEEAWISLLAGKDALGREALRRQLDAMKEDLAGPEPATAIRLLADQVVLCYLAARQAEMAAAEPAGPGLDLAAFRLKRAESTQRRYLAALRTLEQIRARLPQNLTPAEPLRLFDPERKCKRA